jgi:hypothetical protein
MSRCEARCRSTWPSPGRRRMLSLSVAASPVSGVVEVRSRPRRSRIAMSARADCERDDACANAAKRCLSSREGRAVIERPRDRPGRQVMTASQHPKSYCDGKGYKPAIVRASPRSKELGSGQLWDLPPILHVLMRFASLAASIGVHGVLTAARDVHHGIHGMPAALNSERSGGRRRSVLQKRALTRRRFAAIADTPLSCHFSLRIPSIND